MILSIISKIYTKLDSSYIEWKHEIHLGFESLRQDISPLLLEINNDDLLPGYLNIISVADYIKDNKVNFVKKSEQFSINENEMNYNIMIKEEQDKMFDNFKIPEYHKFSKENGKNQSKIFDENFVEFSSMKKEEPLKQLGYEYYTTCMQY